jgi:hypothetical protein
LKWGAGEFNRPIGMLNWSPVSRSDGRSANTALTPVVGRELLSSVPRRRSVKPASKRWQPPEGLSPQDVQVALTAFGQVDNRLERKYEGTGLGLSNVCQRLEARFGSRASCRFGPMSSGGFKVALTMPVETHGRS